MQRSVVVFPAPFEPSSVTISFSLTPSERPNRTCTSPYPASMPRTSSMLLPQVGGDHFRVLHHFLRRPRGDQLSRVEHRHVLAQAHHPRPRHLERREPGDLLLADEDPA